MQQNVVMFFIGLLVRNNLPTDTFVLPYTVKKLLNYISFERRCPVVRSLELGIEIGLPSKFRSEKVPWNTLGTFFVKK